MQLGFFISGTAGQMMQNKLDVISHQIANSNTVGYMEDRAAFSSFFSNKMGRQGAPEQTSTAYITTNRQYVNTHEGNIHHTGNNIDFAIRGDAYFRVQMPDGNEGLTRAGNFKLNSEGQLVTAGNLPVLDQNGAPITLPPGKPNVTANGDIYVDSNPNDDQPGDLVASFGMAMVNDPRQLRKVAGTIVTTKPENIKPADESVSLIQGALEDSNVNSVMEMANLVNTMREYQSMMKVVEQYNQQAGLLSTKVGLVQG